MSNETSQGEEQNEAIKRKINLEAKLDTENAQTDTNMAMSLRQGARRD